MSEQSINIKFPGWSAVAAILLLIVALGFKIVTMNDGINDANLVEKVKFELLTEYFSQDVDKLKAIYQSGDADKLSDAVESVTTTQINIKSIKLSYPIFELSSKKRDIVVKVEFSLDDKFGTRTEGTRYYLFRHSPTFNRWEYRHDSYAWRYYLNFI